MGTSLYFTSAGMLDSHVGAQQPQFQELYTQDTLYFDEGPNQITNKTACTGSLSGSLSNLSSSWPYLQGVEITRQGQYDAGLVKIWSGEPGHALFKSNYGETKNFFPDPGFADLDLFDPVRFLMAQEVDSPLWENIITYPIITGNNDQAENYNFNGIIEPFPIRSVIAFFSIEVPFEAHTVRGQFGNGNADQINGSDSVQTVSNFEPTQQIVGYLDMVDIIEGHPLNGFFRYEFTKQLPFVDQRLVRNTLPPDDEEQSDMVAALSLMTGSTDNYVRYDQVSATSGWYYDGNVSIGTDSLAFGGMTH